MPVKSAVVGCGIAADNYHIPILRSLSNVDLVAVADMDESAMDDVDDVRKYTDHTVLIEEEELDSIHLTTPPSVRIPIIQAAAGAGISVFIEKPTSFETAEVDRMIEIRDEYGISICCTQNMRFLPITQIALDFVSDGEIGKVTAIDNVFSIPKDLTGTDQGQPWAKKLPGGAIGEGAPHLIYTALAFAGRLNAAPEILVREFDTDDFFDGIAIAACDDRERLLTMRYLTRSHPLRRLTVHGTEGNIVVDYLDDRVSIENDNPRTEEPIGFVDRWKHRIIRRLPVDSGPDVEFTGYKAGHFNLITGYIEALETGSPVPVPLEDDRDVVAILQQMPGDLRRNEAAAPNA